MTVETAPGSTAKLGTVPGTTAVPPGETVNRLEPVTTFATPAVEVGNEYELSGKEPSPYDTEEFKKNLQDGIAAQIEGWEKDWLVRISALMEALGLSRQETMLYLMLMQLGHLRGLAGGFQEMWNADVAMKRREMEDQLLSMELEIAARTLGVDPAKGPQPAGRGSSGWTIR